ncbi:hypothetical protein P3T76_007520 [Phytophthora citrophthora]|uniref:ATPase AAA-type core domain-containing protein n=1 Tax=Phytophthora citrophthora TaxID=4793 RepID=A0AAD9GLA3_9STRA|nr:hypothetical protein P3T76_007520 [Phytophthora citrophthora]
MDPTLKIGNDKYFGSNFHSGEGQVHVLVRVPRESVPEHLGVHRDMARDEDLPLAKRVKIAESEIAYQGPVLEGFYSVPMETISTHQKQEVAFSRGRGRICLLYGPRQFGKTTIARRLAHSFAADSSILGIYGSLTAGAVRTEESFWLALGSIVGKETKSSHEFRKMFVLQKTRLWLAIDEMDMMFKNEDLTSTFMDCLREWQSNEYFLGFLGIGSHDLLNMHMKFKGGDTVSPFNLAEVFQVQPFSTDQMCEFFQQIEERYPFRDSTCQGIMEYSSGAPGVFGSLVRYSIDNEQFNVERHGRIGSRSKVSFTISILTIGLTEEYERTCKS